MALNFPDPSASPWTDSNDITWEHDGDGWIAQCTASTGTGSSMIVQEVKPDETLYVPGQEWLRTSDMSKFTLYNDADSRQWVKELNGGQGIQGAPGQNFEEAPINDNWHLRRNGAWSKMELVDALPGVPDADTIYMVKE